MSGVLSVDAHVNDNDRPIDDADFDLIEASTAHMIWWESLSQVERHETPYREAFDAFLAGWRAKATRPVVAGPGPHLIGVTLDDILFANNPVTRIQARAMACDWVSGLQSWMRAEQSRPSFDPAKMLQALAILQMKIHSSVASCLIQDAGAETLSSLVCDINARYYVRHFRGAAEDRQAMGWS